MIVSSTGSAAAAFPPAAAVALGASFVLITRLERLANRLHLSEAMLGLVVALAADSPEITSAVTASIHGQTSIGAGVVLGSNVFNLAALLGLGAIVAGRIALHRKVVILEGVSAIWVAAVCVVILSAGVDAGTGLALVLVVVVPSVIISTGSASLLRHVGLPARAVEWLRQAVTEEEMELEPAIHATPRGRLDVLTAFLALVVVVVASAVMEDSAQTLGTHWHVPNLIVGGVVLAAVTSLPNAVGAVVLARRGRGAAVLSEAMNSNLINVIGGLFIPGLFLGLRGAAGDGSFVAIWYGALTVACLLIAFATRGLSRPQGLAIVAVYVAFVVAAAAR